jgi:hypothetical protein
MVMYRSKDGLSAALTTTTSTPFGTAETYGEADYLISIACPATKKTHYLYTTAINLNAYKSHFERTGCVAIMVYVFLQSQISGHS